MVVDGGLATELEAQGFDLSDRLWSARLLVTEPAAIEAAHLAYYRAGAQVATTASYQASIEGFAAAGIERADGASTGRTERRAREPGEGTLSRGGRRGPHAPRGRLGRPVRRDARRWVGVPRRLRPGHGRAERIPPPADRGARRGRRGSARLRNDPDHPRGRGPGRSARRRRHAGLAELLVPRWSIDIGRGADRGAIAVGAHPRIVAVGINCTAPRHLPALLAAARTATDLPLIAYPNGGERWDAGEPALARRRWRWLRPRRGRVLGRAGGHLARRLLRHRTGRHRGPGRAGPRGLNTKKRMRRLAHPRCYPRARVRRRRSSDARRAGSRPGRASR